MQERIGGVSRVDGFGGNPGNGASRGSPVQRWRGSFYWSRSSGFVTLIFWVRKAGRAVPDSGAFLPRFSPWQAEDALSSRRDPTQTPPRPSHPAPRRIARKSPRRGQRDSNLGARCGHEGKFYHSAGSIRQSPNFSSLPIFEKIGGAASSPGLESAWPSPRPTPVPTPNIDRSPASVVASFMGPSLAQSCSKGEKREREGVGAGPGVI